MLTQTFGAYIAAFVALICVGIGTTAGAISAILLRLRYGFRLVLEDAVLSFAGVLIVVGIGALRFYLEGEIQSLVSWALAASVCLPVGHQLVRHLEQRRRRKSPGGLIEREIR